MNDQYRITVDGIPWESPVDAEAKEYIMRRYAKLLNIKSEPWEEGHEVQDQGGELLGSR